MEQELQIPSCLFGGPPVQDDLIKLGESQIGFMNIFARPLFESVTDILPAMRFAVDEILANKAVWEQKIDDERAKKKKPNLNLGYLSPSFLADPSPSPRSGIPPNMSSQKPPALSTINSVLTMKSVEDARRGSAGSVHAINAEGSRRSSQGADKGSRRSSAAGIPGKGGPVSRENHGSRRGSADASLTAILVTQTPNAADPARKNVAASSEDSSRANRKDTLIRSTSKKADKDTVRPVTAPSQARRSQGKHQQSQLHPVAVVKDGSVEANMNSVNTLYPLPQPSPQSHSEVDLTQSSNGNLDGSKIQQWESNKNSADSHLARSDVSRNSSWWRQRGSRRGGRETRNGEADGHGPYKESTIESTTSHPDSAASSPTHASPGRMTTTDKIKSFFKRKPRQDDQEKQLSSFGSSSQLRTPPTSDPGRSLNSDDTR